MYLDTLSPLKVQVGYGGLGLNGNLGYEGKIVSVQGQTYHHALSAHPPSRITFHLGGRFSSLSCQLALNDDVPRGASHADFFVLVNGHECVAEHHVVAGDPPRSLSVDIAGAELLELVVQTSRWDYCHALWLDPQVSETVIAPATKLIDCLSRAEISLPGVIPSAEHCIATVVSPGFEHMLDDMLGSLYANGGCQDALLIVIALGANEACEQVTSKYRGFLIKAQPYASISPMSKAVLYSVARFVDAKYFLCLDADMIVLGDLRPVFSALEACPRGAILACREGNNGGLNNLSEALFNIYGGDYHDMQYLEITEEEAAYPLVVNDGLFAGGRAALLALDGTIRSMPYATAWADGHTHVWWRNQFLFNLALARLRCGVELDSAYNVQLHVQDVQFKESGALLEAEWHGETVRVLHFSGGAKRKYPEWQGHFSKVSDPLVGAGDGDGYELFLAGLRAWVGRHGLKGLAWSFYGTTDGSTAKVRDPSALPLLALLHFLIRANGCIRILETGTARGISTACMASAVAHHAGGRVVTFDPYLHDGREELWATMPEAISSRIEARTIGSLEGMSEALQAGEHYDAALLDSIHEEEHVWAEFKLAAQLVCSGGLILIHDACYLHGTVEAALRRIEAAGYGVVRLWNSDGGIPEDDHLGLAVIENRSRHIQDV